jgi:subtilisin family serine protease
MSRTKGRPELVVALVDGPVALDHPELALARIKELPADIRGSCSRVKSFACMHGTLVAGMLASRRGSQAPAICPGCTFILRPIFSENTKDNQPMPSASPEELAAAITDAIGAGANVINLSAALVNPSSLGERQLQQALDYSAQRNVLVIAAPSSRDIRG